MKPGTFFGIGVGPGDPELITVKGANILSNCKNVFVPKSGILTESAAFMIAKSYIHPDARVQELVFPMTENRTELSGRWEESAGLVASVLSTGEDVCFLTLGDPLLYSTYIYLLRALRSQVPDLDVVTVPGVTSFNAAAALTEFTIGSGKEPVTIIPTSDDLDIVRRALEAKQTIVLMKIGKHLQGILDILEKTGMMGNAVFVARAGHANQRVETDLWKLKGDGPDAGYLSIILVHANKGLC